MMEPIGALIFSMALSIPNHLPAKGQCLEVNSYAILAGEIYNYDRSDFAYGRCGKTGFRLPDLRSNKYINARYFIKVL